MQMYNKQVIIHKVDEMFENLKERSQEIISINSDLSTASKAIVKMVSSEISIRSQTLFTDMYAEMSEKTLSTSIFDDPERQSRFYEANIRGDILSKYKLDITSISAVQTGINYNEVNRLYLSTAAAAGTAAIGGVLKYVLSAGKTVSIALIIAGAVAAFSISYFKGAPHLTKVSFQKGLEEFLSDTKNEFILWFDEVERYYHEQINNLIKTF